MKLAIFVLLSLAALTGADTGFHQQQNYQNYQNYPYYDQQSYDNSNYYQNSVPSAQRRLSVLDSIRNLFFASNRRQGFGGFGGIIIIVIVVVAMGAVFAAIAAAVSSLDSSGRGLDTDEWEVDHSIWMNQLQKDFEDSWSTE